MIIYGSQYYRPPYPIQADWHLDFQNMRQCGFNTIKLWAVWSWIERRPGECYFEDLDQLLDLCTRYGLKAVINLIPEGVPYWAAREYPDARYTTELDHAVNVGGAANLPSGGSPGLCADHPAVQSLVANFIATVVRRYANHPVMAAFDVWNEPHLEPAWDYPNALFCYCDHSQRRWLAWLQEKYPHLDALNHAWHRAYTAWDDALPPRRFGTYPDMIDWRLFWLHNLNRWLEERVNAARPFAGQVPVMTHMPFSGYLGSTGDGGLAQLLGDEFLLSRKVDQFGLTSFPKWLMNNDFVQHLLHVEMVAAASAGKQFWQSELQPGISKWEAYGRPTATPDEIRLWNWGAVSAGAKGLLYWQWRPEPSGLESPGFGLTSLDGGGSDRTAAASECAADFNCLPAFSICQRAPELNAILVSRTADLYFHAANQGESFYAHALYGAYRACFEGGIPVRMLHSDALIAGDQPMPATLYVPAAVALSDAELNALEAYALDGGRLVVEAACGLYNERGVLRRDLSHFQRLFHASRPELDKADDLVIRWADDIENQPEDRFFFGSHYRQYFHEVGPQAEVLASFSDGKAAVIRCNAGKGMAVWIGTFPSNTLTSSYGRAVGEAVCRWMQPNGYPSIGELNCPAGALVRLFHAGRDRYLSMVNYTRSPLIIKVEFKLSVRFFESSGKGECQQQSLNTLSFSIAARSGALFHLKCDESQA
ncbi:MAG: cellulase family glycosylhydrolase [Anaerolineae bacterium]|nr:cellulase family glycosylhydrolase [Anaerolineae bacterium]